MDKAKVEVDQRDHTGRESVRTGLGTFTQHVLVAVGIAVLVVVLLWLAWTVASVLLLIFAGILVAVLLRGLAELLSQHTPLSERLSVGVVGFTILAAVAVAIWLAGPAVINQTEQLLEELPRAQERVEERLGQFTIGRFLLNQAPSARDLVPGRFDLFTRLTGTVSAVFSAIFNLVLILATGIYLALDPEPYKNGLVRLVPLDKRERAHDVLRVIGYNLKRWVLGRGAALLIDSVLTALGLYLLGMPLVLVLTAIEAVMILVPFIGAILGALPALLIAWLHGINLLYVALLYASIEFLETYVITPLIQEHAVRVPPALLLSTAVLLGLLFGPIGILVAAPLTATMMVIVKMLYIEDALGNYSIEVLGEDENETAARAGQDRDC